MTCDTICLSVAQRGSVHSKCLVVDGLPHYVYEPTTSSDRDVGCEHGQVTPDSGFAHERA